MWNYTKIGNIFLKTNADAPAQRRKIEKEKKMPSIEIFTETITSVRLIIAIALELLRK